MVHDQKDMMMVVNAEVGIISVYSRSEGVKYSQEAYGDASVPSSYLFTLIDHGNIPIKVSFHDIANGDEIFRWLDIHI